MEHQEKVKLLYQNLKDIIDCNLDYDYIYYQKQHQENEKQLLQLLYSFSKRYDVQIEIKYYSENKNRIYINEIQDNPYKIGFYSNAIVFNPQLIKILKKECNCND